VLKNYITGSETEMNVVLYVGSFDDVVSSTQVTYRRKGWRLQVMNWEGYG